MATSEGGAGDQVYRVLQARSRRFACWIPAAARWTEALFHRRGCARRPQPHQGDHLTMDMPIRRLFDPAVLPPRDEDGMCCHPDLLTDRWNMDGHDEVYDRAKFAEAGFEVDFVWFELDATVEQVDRYSEAGEPDVSYWTPSVPEGDGWLFCGIWDTEDMPIAFYVRPLALGVGVAA